MVMRKPAIYFCGYDDVDDDDDARCAVSDRNRTRQRQLIALC